MRRVYETTGEAGPFMARGIVNGVNIYWVLYNIENNTVQLGVGNEVGYLMLNPVAITKDSFIMLL